MNDTPPSTFIWYPFDCLNSEFLDYWNTANSSHSNGRQKIENMASFQNLQSCFRRKNRTKSCEVNQQWQKRWKILKVSVLSASRLITQSQTFCTLLDHPHILRLHEDISMNEKLSFNGVTLKFGKGASHQSVLLLIYSQKIRKILYIFAIFSVNFWQFCDFCEYIRK